MLCPVILDYRGSGIGPVAEDTPAGGPGKLLQQLFGDQHLDALLIEIQDLHLTRDLGKIADSQIHTALDDPLDQLRPFVKDHLHMRGGSL